MNVGADMSKRFIFVGHPRCGSGYISALMEANGFDVGHEIMGTDGTVNWQYTVPDDKVFAWTQGVRDNYKFREHYIYTRDPLFAIPSIAFTETPILGRSNQNVIDSFDFRWKHSGGLMELFNSNNFNSAAASYVGWYYRLLVDPVFMDAPICRVEYLLEDNIIPALKQDVPHNTNARRHRNMTYAEWDTVDEYLIDMLDHWCQLSGYPSLSKRLGK